MSGNYYGSNAAVLIFETDGQVQLKGRIRRGQTLVISYSPGRLPTIRDRNQWYELWNIEASVKFHPGGEFHQGRVFEEIRWHMYFSEIVLSIPWSATQVEMWFKNYSRLSGAEAWDSRYGQNYWFPVEPG